MKKARIFYSYAHEDTKLRIELEKHLANLKSQGLITTWHDRNINAGSDWYKETNTNLNTADIILLLVSPDFMHSDYCNSVELMRALERHNNETTKVIPIILRHVDYEGAPFSHLQTLPTNAVPIRDRKWRSLDEAFRDVAKGLRTVVSQVIGNLLSDDGKVHLYRQEYNEALDAFEKAISFCPENAHAHCGKGQTLLLANASNEFTSSIHLTEALASFNEALQLEPNNVLALIGKAEAAYRTKPRSNFKAAIDLYKQALNFSPENEEIYIKIADTYKNHMQYDEALSFYEKAMELAPFSSRAAYTGKARALKKLGRYEEALSIYKTLSAVFPDSNKEFEEIGDILFETKDYNSAIINFNEALNKPNIDDTIKSYMYIKIGNTYSNLEMYEKAFEAFERSIKLDSSNFDAHKKKAGILQILAQASLDKAEQIENEIFSDDHPF